MNTWSPNQKESKLVAFCHYHDYGLTAVQLKCKGCLFKKNISQTCPHLEKLEHKFWEERNKKKQQRKERKQRMYGEVAT